MSVLLACLCEYLPCAQYRKRKLLFKANAAEEVGMLTTTEERNEDVDLEASLCSLACEAKLPFLYLDSVAHYPKVLTLMGVG